MSRAPAHPFDILVSATASGTTAWERGTGTRATAADLASALSALSPRPRHGARVLVASATLFSQRVRLANARADLLSPVELEGALFYEVEPFCGVRREDAVLAIDRIAPGEWRVSVADRTELSALRDRVRTAGFRFAGAVPLPSSTDAAEDPAVLSDALFPAGATPSSILKPPRGGPSPRTLAMFSALAVAAIAVFCAADWFFLDTASRRMRPALLASESAAAANMRLRREIQSGADRLQAIEDARLRRENAIAALQAARGRWADLLAVLADAAGCDTVIRSIAAEEASGTVPVGARIDGFAASPPAAAEAMSRLAGPLRDAGWELRPGAVEERTAGAAAFAFSVHPVCPPEEVP